MGGENREAVAGSSGLLLLVMSRRGYASISETMPGAAFSAASI
jgi:hypothetical protein